MSISIEYIQFRFQRRNFCWKIFVGKAENFCGKINANYWFVKNSLNSRWILQEIKNTWNISNRLKCLKSFKSLKTSEKLFNLVMICFLTEILNLEVTIVTKPRKCFEKLTVCNGLLYLSMWLSNNNTWQLIIWMRILTDWYCTRILKRKNPLKLTTILQIISRKKLHRHTNFYYNSNRNYVLDKRQNLERS